MCKRGQWPFSVSIKWLHLGRVDSILVEFPDFYNVIGIQVLIIVINLHSSDRYITDFGLFLARRLCRNKIAFSQMRSFLQAGRVPGDSWKLARNINVFKQLCRDRQYRSTL